MSNNISKQRLAAFKKQSGKCYYCGCRMWLKDRKQFALKYGISELEASRFQCTGEHLLAKSDGGKNSYKNIVAACLFCNSTRHKMKKPPIPTRYKSHIQQRLNKGKWHPFRLQHLRPNARV